MALGQVVKPGDEGEVAGRVRPAAIGGHVGEDPREHVLVRRGLRPAAAPAGSRRRSSGDASLTTGSDGAAASSRPRARRSCDGRSRAGAPGRT